MKKPGCRERMHPQIVECFDKIGEWLHWVSGLSDAFIRAIEMWGSAITVRYVIAGPYPG